MRRLSDLKDSSAHKLIELCWGRCVLKTRHKYLQSTEILELIREVERFLGIQNFLKPEEESLLRSMIRLKPQLRLFRGECLSFILGLAQFRTLEELFETRFRITPERLASLVDAYLLLEPVRSSGPASFRDAVPSLAHVSDRPYKDTNIYDRYNLWSTDSSVPGGKTRWGMYSDPRETRESKPATKASWLSRWNYGPNNHEPEKVRFESSLNEKQDLQTKPEKSSWVSKALLLGKQWLPITISGPKQALESLTEDMNAERGDHETKPPFIGSVENGHTSSERKLQELRQSLAEIRSQARRLEYESKRASSKSLTESLNELQAAVRDQARVISLLERERARDISNAFSGLVSLLYVPWHYFTGLLTTFMKDLLEELLPANLKRSPPDFIVRVLSLMLGFVVIINFFKLIFFVVVITLHTSESTLPYIFYDEVIRESAPTSWIQGFPTLEYWSYQLKDALGY